MAPTKIGSPALPCTRVSPVSAPYSPWLASRASAMIGLNAVRNNVASISSAICSSRPLRTASVTASSLFIALTEFEHVIGADDVVDALEVEHAIAERRGGAMCLQ